MKIQIDEIPVYFPYEFVYPEQLKYMREVKRTLDNRGHCLLEMPSGTGKTVALLSITVSYQMHMKAKNMPFKIVYCSRTVPEVDKALKELEKLISYIRTYQPIEFLGLGLTGRKNLCINKTALESFNIDLACRRLTTQLIESKCDFYENLNNYYEVPVAVYDFSQLREIGKKQGLCPYYLVRRSIPVCDCIIYTYNYLIDPRIYAIISKELGSESVVIFDEAHNIDGHCIEALSIEIKRGVLEGASRATKKIEGILSQKRNSTNKVLAAEYERMKGKLLEPTADTIPYFYAAGEGNYEFVPGNLRNSFHVVSVLKRITEFLKTKLKTTHLTTETTESFCKNIKELAFIEKKTLQFCSHRLGILSQSLGLDDEDMSHLKMVADFSTMISMYSKGFAIIFEPFDTQAQSVFNPILRLACLDSSIAMAPIFSKFKNVIITSGTLSPIDMYPKILNFVPARTAEIGATLDRNAISPLIITKGNDQMTLKASGDDGEVVDVPRNKDMLTTSFSLRSDPSVVRNYGLLIIELSKVVPDGIVCFFPSYLYMEEIVSLWAETNVITEISKNKLVFVETPDYKETETALLNYKKACDNGRGGVLFSVARGKVSEGVDFEDGYGRCVVMLGVPFQYTESVRLKKRLEFLRAEYNIKEYDFLTFDAMRHAAQCLGRVLRNKNDYGLMILADERFERNNKKSKLPKWIQNFIDGGNCNLSVDMALSIARRFYREMAQECVGTGSSLLSRENVESFAFN